MAHASLQLEMQDLCNIIGMRLDDDHDLVIAITGDEGYGKSTLGEEIASTFDPQFHLIRNVAYLPTSKEVADKFHALPKKSAFLIDEAIKILYKLKWQDRLQLLINEMYATERWQNKLTLLCIPRFTDLNEQFRHHRVMVWIHIIERGIGLIFVKDRFAFTSVDPWYLATIEKMIKDKRKWKRNIDINDLVILLNRLETFNGYILFTKMDKETDEEYRRIKAEMRDRADEILDDKTRQQRYLIQRNQLFKFIRDSLFRQTEDGFKPIKETDIGRLVGITQDAVSLAIKTVERKEKEENM